MPQAAAKMVWSISSCNFCPRSDVRTCQIKPGKLLSKLSSALDMHESLLESSEGICTCCLADVDMIIRAIAIRGAMKDYYLDMVQKGYSQNTDSNHCDGHAVNPLLTTAADSDGNGLHYNGDIAQHELSAPPLPVLLARPSAAPRDQDVLNVDSSPLSTQSNATSSLNGRKKPKERLTRYQCMLCDKIAGSKSHCMEHLICHSPVRPFTCSQCMKTYKSRKACREHLIVMHGVERVEENLQKMVVVDIAGLKQLEAICTQYRKVTNHSDMAKLSNDDDAASSVGIQSLLRADPLEEVTSEPADGGGSAWLYKPFQTSPRHPPPLLQCIPSSYPDKGPAHTSTATAQPPCKRTRKSKPQKVVNSYDVSEPALDEELDVKEEYMDQSENSNDCSTPTGVLNKWQSVNSSGTDAFTFRPLSTDKSADNSQTSGSVFPGLEIGTSDQTISSPTTPTSDLLHGAGSPRKPVPPPCHICGRSFPTKEKMADHMRSHSEIKQFSCLVCNRFFKYRRGVTNHLKEVHHMTDKVEISSKVASHEKGYVVPRCGRFQAHELNHNSMPAHQDGAQPCDTNVSQKVIEDTLLSLADIHSNVVGANNPIHTQSSDESSADMDFLSIVTDEDHQSTPQKRGDALTTGQSLFPNSSQFTFTPTSDDVTKTAELHKIITATTAEPPPLLE